MFILLEEDEFIPSSSSLRSAEIFFEETKEDTEVHVVHTDTSLKFELLRLIIESRL
jgi:hypothetical protein